MVLLSTYNGEKYLCEQLDSLIAQKNVDLKILVRDDGSSDNTREILEKYYNAYPDKIIINFAENIGCTGSFFALMKLAVKKYGDYEYFAFSDQDDVWLPDKLYSAALALDAIDGITKLYYCSHTLVDETLTPIKSTPVVAKGTLEESFILQPCIGCTMVFSKDLLVKASNVDSLKINIHDAWVYKLCLSLSGNVIHDSTPHILYRQHTSNTIGGAQGFTKKWKRRINDYFLNSKHNRSNQARLILQSFQSEIPTSKKSTLSDMSNYHRSIRKKLKIIFDKDYSSYYRLHNIMFKICILFGKI